MITLVLIGDPNPQVIAHAAIPRAVELAAIPAQIRWLPTREIHSARDVLARRPDAIWCVPGSPYENMEGTLVAIRFARENGIPFLGTCGGFQHALIEFARNVIGLRDADHAESNPAASAAVIDKLTCPLVNQSEALDLVPGSKLHAIYSTAECFEPYQCSYGLNTAYAAQLGAAGLKFSAMNAEGLPRAFELASSPFHIGTLFQPERSALRGDAHPLICEFLRAAAAHK
jgi:CTP synthase (UTP-ammonia lyase)